MDKPLRLGMSNGEEQMVGGGSGTTHQSDTIRYFLLFNH